MNTRCALVTGVCVFASCSASAGLVQSRLGSETLGSLGPDSVFFDGRWNVGPTEILGIVEDEGRDAVEKSLPAPEASVAVVTDDRAFGFDDLLSFGERIGLPRAGTSLSVLLGRRALLLASP